MKDEGGPLRALAHGEGTHFLVVVIDGEVFAGVRIEGPAGAYGAFEGLTADDAALLAQALGHPPLWATYTDEGQKPYAFRRAREMRAGFVRVFGEEYLAARVGALDDLVFVALGSRAGLTEETVAVLRKGGRPLPPGLATSLGHAPGAGFLLRVDLGALVDGFAAMMSAFMGERMPDMGLSLPDGLEPALLAGWGEGEGIRARLRLDGRLFAHFEEQERELRLKRAASQVEGMHEMVLDWRKETGATGLPGPDEPFFGYVMREDPWGTEVRVEGGAGGDVRVTSAGPDGVFDTDDDISAPPK